MRGDVPDNGEPQKPDEEPDSTAWSIEDFDNFDDVDDPTADAESAERPARDTEHMAEDDESVAEDPDSAAASDSGGRLESQKPVPFQPGFEFTELEVEADFDGGVRDAPAAGDDQPGFGDLWATAAGQEDDATGSDFAAPAAIEYEEQADEPSASPEPASGERPSRSPAPDQDEGSDADATAEFVPYGVETSAPVSSVAGGEPTNGRTTAPADPAAATGGAATRPPADGPYDHEVADEERPDEVTEERLDEITAERLYSTSTQEYAGLAEHVARSAGEDQELMAVAADMPGLERGVVGLDDVVEASGVDHAPTASRRSSDLPLRIGTAVLLLAVFIGSLYRPLFLGLLALVVLGLAAGEFYTVLVRSGFNPLTVFGLAGVVGAMIGTWIFGPVAIPMSLAAALLLTLIFYTVASGRSLPLFNAALTMMVAVWIGLGAFVFDMLRAPDFRWLIVAVIVTVAFMDICQYFVGRKLGRTPLAPRISPKKTVEGLLGGILGALFVGVFFGLFESGPFDLGSGLLLGLAVAVVAPFGDLAISVVKRSLDVKDMGTILPGHGGVLDRIDAMLIVVPVAWVAYAWLGLLR